MPDLLRQFDQAMMAIYLSAESEAGYIAHI
jgi:hypothetical protein